MLSSHRPPSCCPTHPHTHPPTLPQVAILAGDFLLARASVSLASLRNPEAIMLMSQSLEHLVAGEILQVRVCMWVGRGGSAWLALATALGRARAVWREWAGFRRRRCMQCC